MSYFTWDGQPVLDDYVAQGICPNCYIRFDYKGECPDCDREDEDDE